MTLKLFATASALVAANFIYQAITSQDWGVAFDRSFFQSAALFVAWLILST